MYCNNCDILTYSREMMCLYIYSEFTKMNDSRIVVIAVDDSEHSEYAFDCKLYLVRYVCNVSIFT